MTTLIPKTTPPFCQEWQRASISSSHHIVTGRASILILIITSSLSLDASGEGEGEAMNPPRRAYHWAIQLTWVFTWHNSSLIVSRRASMRWSCAMTTSRVTPLGAEEAEGVAVSIYGHLGRSWAFLHLTIAASMAYKAEKCVDLG